MSAPPASDPATDIAAVLGLEQRRCRSLVDKDLASLRELVAAELVHIHATGRVEDRDAYLQGVEANLDFVRVERGELVVRIFGNTAVVTGTLDQLVRVRASRELHDMRCMATQVWVRSAAQWRQVSFQATCII
jgi:hypothetical protein